MTRKCRRNKEIQKNTLERMMERTMNFRFLKCCRRFLVLLKNKRFNCLKNPFQFPWVTTLCYFFSYFILLTIQTGQTPVFFFCPIVVKFVLFHWHEIFIYWVMGFYFLKFIFFFKKNNVIGVLLKKIQEFSLNHRFICARARAAYDKK